jgi:hypothetical protein
MLLNMTVGTSASLAEYKDFSVAGIRTDNTKMLNRRVMQTTVITITVSVIKITEDTATITPVIIRRSTKSHHLRRNIQRLKQGIRMIPASDMATGDMVILGRKISITLCRYLKNLIYIICR